MDNVLRDLFDFQRFARNEKLGRLIDETYDDIRLIELSDDMLEAAAGGKSFMENDEKENKHDLI